MVKQMMNSDAARAIAQDALLWLVGDPATLGAFLHASGATREALQAGLADPEFLGFVLDFLLADETLVRRFATEHDLAPQAPLAARAALPGGDLPHWT